MTKEKLIAPRDATPDLLEACYAWLLYATTDYSGDGMTALELTKKAVAKAQEAK